MEMIKYDAACRAVALARTVDEAKEIGDRAEALRAYARQAKNRTIELDALEIRARAERRIGELVIEMRKEKTFKNGRPKLADFGLTGAMMTGCQRLALIGESAFKDGLIDWRAKVERASVPHRPFREIRNPSEAAAAAKRSFSSTPRIDQSDPLDEYRSLDGRPLADVLAGEIRALEARTLRQLSALKAIREQMPVANPDSLTSLRVIFGERKLLAALEPIWRGESAPPRASGLETLPSRRGGSRPGAGRKPGSRNRVGCHAGTEWS